MCVFYKNICILQKCAINIDFCFFCSVEKLEMLIPFLEIIILMIIIYAALIQIKMHVTLKFTAFPFICILMYKSCYDIYYLEFLE